MGQWNRPNPVLTAPFEFDNDEDYAAFADAREKEESLAYRNARSRDAARARSLTRGPALGTCVWTLTPGVTESGLGTVARQTDSPTDCACSASWRSHGGPRSHFVAFPARRRGTIRGLDAIHDGRGPIGPPVVDPVPNVPPFLNITFGGPLHQSVHQGTGSSRITQRAANAVEAGARDGRLASALEIEDHPPIAVRARSPRPRT